MLEREGPKLDALLRGIYDVVPEHFLTVFDFTEVWMKAFCAENPEQGWMKIPLWRWAWNHSGKVALGGLTPYTVLTGLQPQEPLNS